MNTHSKDRLAKQSLTYIVFCIPNGIEKCIVKDFMDLVLQKADFLSYFFVKKYLLVGASGMLWAVQ